MASGALSAGPLKVLVRYDDYTGDSATAIEKQLFEAVHRIPGICGDPNTEVHYEWVDAAPVELSTLHYRIRLGSDGISSVKQVRFDQLVETQQRAWAREAEALDRLASISID